MQTTEQKEIMNPMMEVWTKSMEMVFKSAAEGSNGWPFRAPVWASNGFWEKSQQAMRTSQKIGRSLAMSLANPEGLMAIPGAVAELQDMFLQSQEREFQNLSKLQTEWFDRADRVRNVVEKLYVRHTGPAQA